MNADRVITDWLRGSAPARAPQQLLNSTIERIATTPQELKGTARIRVLTRRRPNSRMLLIAAALVGGALLGSQLVAGGRHDLRPSPADQTFSPGPSAPLPTAAPLPTPALPAVRGTLSTAGVTVYEGALSPGRYETGVDGAAFSVQFTVPAGWSWDGRALRKGGPGLPDGAAVFFYGGPLQVYADPCHWATIPSSAPTADAVDALLAAQPGRIVTTSLEGAWYPRQWPGKAIEVVVPGNIDISACDEGQYRSWGPDNKVRSNEGPGQRDLVWFINVQGGEVMVPGSTPYMLPSGLVIDRASFPGTPADVLTEMDDILGSLYVGHWG